MNGSFEPSFIVQRQVFDVMYSQRILLLNVDVQKKTFSDYTFPEMRNQLYNPSKNKASWLSRILFTNLIKLYHLL